MYLRYLLTLSFTALCFSQDGSYRDPYNPNIPTRQTDHYTNDPYNSGDDYSNNNGYFNNYYDPNHARNPYDLPTPKSDPAYRDRFNNDNVNRYNQNNDDLNRYNSKSDSINRYNPRPDDVNRYQYGNRNEGGLEDGVSTRPAWQDTNYVQDGYSGPELERDSVVINEATYFIVASRVVRPGQIYKISASIVQARLQMTIRASISCNGVELADVSQSVREGVPETLNIKIPDASVPGDYKLRVEGLYLDDPFVGKAFVNESKLIFSKRFMTIFIQMDKPVYMQGQTVRFRAIPINTDLKAFSRAVDVYILDPNRRIMKRWLSRQSNYGTVSLDYKLSDQPVFGEWFVQVQAAGQLEETNFLVEEYYQTRFEVNVTMPAFFFNTDPFIHGRINANYTTGAPVKGNLTLKATIRPIPQFRPQYYTQGQFNNRGQFGVYPDKYTSQYTRARNFDPQYNGNVNGTNQYPGSNPQYPGQFGYDEFGSDFKQSELYIPGRPNQLDQPGWVYDKSKVVERLFNFDEVYPFWITKPDLLSLDYNYYGNTYNNDQNNNYNPNNNYNTQPPLTAFTNTYNYGTTSYNRYNQPLPFLRFFNGTYEFSYPMSELQQLVPSLDGVEVIITASVGEQFLDEVIEGYSIARIFNSSLKVTFLGGSPQVFKPAMPFDVYMSVSYHDGSKLPDWLVGSIDLTVNVQLEGRGGNVEPLKPVLAPGHDSIWHLKIDLKKLLKLEDARAARETLSGVTGVRLGAQLLDGAGGQAHAEMLFVAHHSPRQHHIRLHTTTTDAKVGEYIIFHVQSNFYMQTFNYLVMSKGIILTTDQEVMQNGVRTFAVSLSAEMAPVATVVVWATERHGVVVADSLTFPVNGISRNNFTVFVNNRKHRTGERVEVAIYGEPGAYVGLSAIDNAFYTMQAGNELTYAKVISKMARFDEETNGTFSYSWHSHAGIADELVYFPSSSFGVDANRTFEYSGLIVFSDVPVTRRDTHCNASLGYGECLEGSCYPLSKRCDNVFDCPDHTDEANCESDNSFELSHFRKFRFNRLQRQYENVWLWKDANIGPHGRYVFNVDVPTTPVHWTISAFSMSPTLGLGMMRQPLQYSGVLPFFIQVEGPDRCKQGEQLGLRVAVFNYQRIAIEAVVVLHSSPDYKFVHVEEDGIVRSYNPRTSFGEHQFFVYIMAGETTTVYLPIVPQRLGEIRVTIHAAALIGTHSHTKKILVEADGVPQYRHQSILLDLSNRAYAYQYLHVNITETPVIPYEVDRYYVFGSNRATVSVTGDVVGPLFPTMPVNATSLLNLPMDSAEQNMFSFAANMYQVLYMRQVNQRNRTTEREAFHHLNTLYQRQLSFMKPDGSFSTFRSDWNQSSSSVWLTAFCARIFYDASFYEWENYIYIDPKVISLAVSWVLKHQNSDGSFYEVSWLPDRNYNSSLRRPGDAAEQDLALTAHVVITLETVKSLKDVGIIEGLSSLVVQAQQRALAWLEIKMPQLEKNGEAYDVAIVAYALTLCSSPKSEKAFTLLKSHVREEGGLLYWGKKPVPPPPYKMENQKPFMLPRLPYEYDSNNIASTALALLTCNNHQENNEPIVAWLNTQRLTDGGWASTQDTYWALKALVEYTSRKRLRDVSFLTVNVEAVALRDAYRTLQFDETNFPIRQSIDIPEAWGTVKVTAKGAGYAILQLSVQYNVDIARFQTAPPVRAFDLQTQARFQGRNQSHIEYQSCARWTGVAESPRSGMAVLDVAVPTGYMIQQQRLDAYVLSRAVPTLQRAKYLPTKLLFYFDYLGNENTCVNFTLERWFPVANMSRYLPIRVYDYYAPERFNETIFDALPTYLLNICEVCGSSQCPYCSIYNPAAKPVATLSLLLAASVAALARYWTPQFVRLRG